MEHILPRQDRHASDEMRWIYGLGGAALFLWGLRRRSVAGTVASSIGLDLLNWTFTGHYLHEALGVTGLASKGLRALIPHQLGIKVDRSISVYRPAEEVYRFFRDFTNLPRFLAHVNDIREIDDKRSHWYVKGPAGMEVEWDAEIIKDEPNELISWRSSSWRSGGSADVESTGSVRFERMPGNRGTIVRVSLNYMPPAGALGAVIAKLFGEEPEKQIKDDLRRMKQILEAGEIASVEGQPKGPSHAPRAEHRPERLEEHGAEPMRAVRAERAKAASSGTDD